MREGKRGGRGGDQLIPLRADVKATYAEVKVSDAGKGEFIVDGMSLDTFQSLQAR